MNNTKGSGFTMVCQSLTKGQVYYTWDGDVVEEIYITVAKTTSWQLKLAICEDQNGCGYPHKVNTPAPTPGPIATPIAGIPPTPGPIATPTVIP